MKRYVKPSSFLFYFLTILVFFFMGVSYVIVTGSAEGQGLAAGAIVIGTGVVFAFVALVLSFVALYFSSGRFVKKANLILFITLILFIAFFIFRFYQRHQKKDLSSYQPAISPTALAMASPQEFNPPTDDNDDIGLGFFKPKLFNTPSLFFYGKPGFMKPVAEHSPYDSLTFKEFENGGYDISYAPPWFVPHHLKLDYDILYLKVTGISGDFAEVIVNSLTQQKVWVDRRAGKLLFWPEFLLSVYSVEFPDGAPQTVRVKPLSYAGKVTTDFDFMKPVFVRDKWMQVNLLDGDLNKVAEGWIRWRNENSLLIRYSLLC